MTIHPKPREDVSDLGSFDGLRAAWRKTLDEPSDEELEARGIQVIRHAEEGPSP